MTNAEKPGQTRVTQLTPPGFLTACDLLQGLEKHPKVGFGTICMLGCLVLGGFFSQLEKRSPRKGTVCCIRN